MTRKMAWIGSFYLAGLLLASFLDGRTRFFLTAALLLFGTGSRLLIWDKRSRLTVCFISAAAGMILYSGYDRFVYENVVQFRGQEVQVYGKVTAVSDYGGDKSAYTVKGSVNGVRTTVTCYTDSLDVRIGDKVGFAGKAAVPEDSYSFPAKSYYKAKGIFLRIYGAKDFSTQRTSFSVMRTINSYREYLLDIVYQGMDSDCAGVMCAMLFGDKSGIDSDEKTLMYRAGIGHVMAVSGVHLSVVCSLFWFLLRRLPINKYIRFVLLLVPVAAFVLMAGASNSVLRAAVMMVLVYGSELFRRRSDTFSSLGVAVIALTIACPYAARDASFLLSVSGVFGIGVLVPMAANQLEKYRKLGKTAKSVIASFCAMVAVFPAAMLFFDEVSVISPISNVLLLPICELALLGGIIVALTGGVSFIAVPVLTVCEICCKVVLTVSAALGKLRFAYVPLGIPVLKYLALAGAAVAALAFLMFRKKGRAVIFASGIFAAVIVFTNVYRYLPDGNITVTVFCDDGAAVVHDKRSAWVIDTGGGEAAADTVKYLNRNGIYTVDAVALCSGANLSLPVYKSKLGLFDTNTYMAPLGEEYLVSGYEGDICFYGEKISANGFEVCFPENGDITLVCRDAEIILPSDGGAPLVRFGGEVYRVGNGSENVSIIIGRDGVIRCAAL